MSRRYRLRVAVVAVVATALALTVETVHADEARPVSCPCQEGGTYGVHTVPQWSALSTLARPQVVPQPAPVPSAVLPVIPPPGTLGQTYKRRSWVTPVEKHPRAAMLDVTVAGASEVRVYNTNQYRLHDELDGFQNPDNADVWHFESDPLVPGLPHIYRIEAVRDGIDPELADVRYVRLIRGRRVTLEYEPLGVIE